MLWVLASFATLFGLWHGYRLLVENAAAETIRRHRARLPEEREALAAIRRERPPVLEPFRPGNAWELILAFVRETEKRPRADLLPPAELRAADGVVHELDSLLHVASSLPPPPFRPFHEFAFDHQHPREWLEGLADRHLAGGRTEEALETTLLALGYAHELERQGSLGFRDFGLSMESAALRRAMGLLGRDLSPTAERRAGLVMERLDRMRAPLAASLGYERVSEREKYSEVLEPGGGLLCDFRVPGWRSLVFPPKVHVAWILGALDEAYEGLESAMRDTNEDGTEALRRIRRVAEIRVGCFDVQHWELVFVADTNARALCRAARTAFAVAEFAGRTGAFPPNLESLRGDFFSAVPLDPWTGRPLRYDGGRIWSARGAEVDGTQRSADLGNVVVTVPPPRR